MSRITTLLLAIASTTTLGCTAETSNTKTQEPSGKPVQTTPNTSVPMQKHTATFSVSDFTKAPKRYSTSVTLDASPEEVWTLVADHEALPSYLPAIEKVVVNNTNADIPGGVGATRACSIMGNDLNEEIRVFEPGKLLGYSVVSGGFPGVTNHFALVRLTAMGAKTKVTFEQYFDSPDTDAVVTQITPLFEMAKAGLLAKFK